MWSIAPNMTRTTPNGWLVGGFNHLENFEKYEFVNGKDDIPYIMKVIKPCFKPPTRWDCGINRWIFCGDYCFAQVFSVSVSLAPCKVSVSLAPCNFSFSGLCSAWVRKSSYRKSANVKSAASQNAWQVWSKWNAFCTPPLGYREVIPRFRLKLLLLCK